LPVSFALCPLRSALCNNKQQTTNNEQQTTNNEQRTIEKVGSPDSYRGSAAGSSVYALLIAPALRHL